MIRIKYLLEYHDTYRIVDQERFTAVITTYHIFPMGDPYNSIHILFYFTDIKFYIYLCTLLCVYILLLLYCFGWSQYILLLSIIPSSFYHNHTIWSHIHNIGHWYIKSFSWSTNCYNLGSAYTWISTIVSSIWQISLWMTPLWWVNYFSNSPGVWHISASSGCTWSARWAAILYQQCCPIY